MVSHAHFQHCTVREMKMDGSYFKRKAKTRISHPDSRVTATRTRGHTVLSYFTDTLLMAGQSQTA